jgi:DNA-binding NarL/FixJ family response regulator
MDKKLKIIIVDDHDMFREGVKVLLGKSQKVEFIGEASDGKEFLKLIETLDPDVVLMDISMPVMDGIEATRQAVLLKPDIKIMALSMFGEEEYYYKMIQSGVRGFVMKSAGINELEYAIQEIAKGSPYFSAELLQYVWQYINEKQDKDNLSILTTPEINILKSIARNLSDEDIAKDMNESVESVNKLRTGLFSKTGSKNTAGLVMYAIKNGIINL